VTVQGRRRRTRTTTAQLPRIGPCHDPLHLWFLEWADANGQRWRKYFPTRVEARVALAQHRIELELQKLDVVRAALRKSELLLLVLLL